MRQSPFGELIWGVSFLPTAALLRSLQWFSWYRSRSAESAAHTQSVCIRGCVATAGRHSLLCLLRQLVALIQQVAIRFRCSFSATLWKPVLHVFMSKTPVLHVFMSKYTSSCLHANIVQRVKMCYKIKIDSRVPVCCFFGVLLCKQHPRITIAPLLQSNSATIRQ